MKKSKLLILLTLLTMLIFSSGYRSTGEKGSFPGTSGIAVAPNGKVLYIAEQNAMRIDVFNIHPPQIIKSIPLNDKPSAIFISNDDKLLVLQGEVDGKLLIFNRKNLNKEIEIPAGHSPCDLSESDDNYIICNRFPGEISFVSKETLKTVKRIKVGREPIGIVSDKDKDILYVAHHLPEMSASDKVVASKITIINLKNQAIIKTILLPNGSNGLKDICLSTDGKYIFVAHILARFNLPTTQLERGWMNTNALSIIDTEQQTLWNTVLLDDIEQGAANPWAVECPGKGDKLYITHAGTHEISIINWTELKKALEKTEYENQAAATSENLSFIYPFRKRIKISGNGPRSIIITDNQIITGNHYSGSLSILDVKSLKEDHIILGQTDLNPIQKGEMYFNDAAFCFQGWQSCASCHPDARIDGLNWDLMNDGIGNPKNTRSMVYSHKTPPVMSLGVRAHAKIAVRAGFKFIQFADVPEKYSSDVDAYLESLIPLPTPFTNPESEKGRKVFIDQGCAACHSGPYYTDLKSYALGTDTLLKWDTPMLNELWRTAPYWHDGKYESIGELFETEKHGLENRLSEEDLKLLEQYLLTL